MLVLPAVVHKVLATFSLAISLSLDGLTFACVAAHGYLSRLVFWMSAPIVVLALMATHGIVRTLCGRRTRPLTAQRWRSLVLEQLTPTFLRVMFLTYPIVTNVAFEAFSCVRFDDGNTWLIADVSVRCGTPAHQHVKNVAWGAVLAYPLGVWALNAVFLALVRRAVLSGRETALAHATGFLHREYKTQFFSWELMEMGRRFLLVGLFVVVPYERGKMMQLILAVSVSFGYLAVQCVAQPYRSFSDNLLGIACSVSLTTLLLGCSYFKYAALTELTEVQQVMRSEQEFTYLLDQTMLVGVLLLCVTGTLIACALIVAVQFWAEVRRRRQEARAAIARRLRYRKDMREVPVPKLGRCDFHCFLSHVWGTGQDQVRATVV